MRMPTVLRLVWMSLGTSRVASRMKHVRPGQISLQEQEGAVLDDRVARDVGEVGADERELLRLVHLLDLVEPVDRPLVEEIAAQPVHRVGRITDDFAGFERVDGTADLARLGMVGIDRKQHDERAGHPRLA